MDNTPLDSQPVINEAKALLNAAWNTSLGERYELLIAWAKELLQPLADKNDAEALWLLHSMPKDNAEQLSDEEFDRRRMIEAKKAADAGSATAKFFLACELDEEPTFKESTQLFKEAAERGHTYSKWCYGLNLLSGRGVVRDEALGLRYIEEAGNEKFEGAIRFLADAYANGTFGYPKNEGAAASWWAKLKDKDVIHY